MSSAYSMPALSDLTGMSTQDKVVLAKQIKAANDAAPPFSSQADKTEKDLDTVLDSDPNVAKQVYADTASTPSASSNAVQMAATSPTPANLDSNPNARASDDFTAASDPNVVPLDYITGDAAKQDQLNAIVQANAPVTGQIDATIPGNLSPPPASSSALLGVTAPNANDAAAAAAGWEIQPAPKAPPPSPTTGVAILCARGTTMVTELNSNSNTHNTGYYAIEEWSRYPDTLRQQNTNSKQVQNANLSKSISTQVKLAPILITGCTFSHRDVISQTLCMNNVKVLYSFGQNYGDVTIAGEILLGNFGDLLLANNTVKTFVDFFWKYRVSNYLAPVTVSAVNEKFLTYLVGMDFGDIIPDVHILPFLLHGILLDVSRNKKAVINPPSVVLSTADIFNSSIAAALSKTTSVNTSLTGVGTTTSASTSAANTTNAANAAAAQIQIFNKDNIPSTLPTKEAAALPSAEAAAPDTGACTDPVAICAKNAGSLTPTQKSFHDAYVADLNKGLKDPLSQDRDLADLGDAVTDEESTRYKAVQNERAVQASTINTQASLQALQ